MANGVPGPGGGTDNPVSYDNTEVPRWGSSYTPTNTISAPELAIVQANPNQLPRILAANPGVTRQDVRYQLSRSQFGSGS